MHSQTLNIYNSYMEGQNMLLIILFQNPLPVPRARGVGLGGAGRVRGRPLQRGLQHRRRTH
jgi:hypothetical protein